MLKDVAVEYYGWAATAIIDLWLSLFVVVGSSARWRRSLALKLDQSSKADISVYVLFFCPFAIETKLLCTIMIKNRVHNLL